MGQKSWYGTCWYDPTPHLLTIQFLVHITELELRQVPYQGFFTHHNKQTTEYNHTHALFSLSAVQHIKISSDFIFG